MCAFNEGNTKCTGDFRSGNQGREGSAYVGICWGSERMRVFLDAWLGFGESSRRHDRGNKGDIEIPPSATSAAPRYVGITAKLCSWCDLIIIIIIIHHHQRKCVKLHGAVQLGS